MTAPHVESSQEFDSRRHHDAAQLRPQRFHRAPQALGERDARLVAQVCACERDVGLRMADVAGAGGAVDRVEVGAEDFVEILDELQDGDRVAVADVVDLAGIETSQQQEIG